MILAKHYNFSNRVKMRVYAKAGGKCTYCGTKLTNEDILDWGGKVVTVRHHWNVDHATPISRGGSNDFSNLVPACPTCNADKGTMTANEFIAMRER